MAILPRNLAVILLAVRVRDASAGIEPANDVAGLRASAIY